MKNVKLNAAFLIVIAWAVLILVIFGEAWK